MVSNLGTTATGLRQWSLYTECDRVKNLKETLTESRVLGTEDRMHMTRLNYVDYFVLRGYVVVVQDTRGRYTSDGEYYPLIHEAVDG